MKRKNKNQNEWINKVNRRSKRKRKNKNQNEWINNMYTLEAMPVYSDLSFFLIKIKFELIKILLEIIEI